MTNRKTAVAGAGTTDGANPSSACETERAFDENSIISDKRRVQDALEDDEVREVLRAFHRLPGAPVSPGRG